MKKLIFAFLIAAMTPLTAFAWKAMSVNYWPIPRVYISHEMPTLEEARAEALSRCRKVAVSTMTGPENCRPYGSAISGETAVVVHGENGLIWASSNEPKEALSLAMANCKKVSTTCVPFAATHSSHVRFRSGPACLNSFTPRDKETACGLKRCRVVHGGGGRCATNRPTRWATRGAPGFSF